VRFALLVLLLGCDNTIFPAPPSTGAGVTGRSYADVRQVFDGDCIACHSGPAATGGLDLATDPCAVLVGATDVNGDVLVVPGDHAASVLWNRVAGTDVYGPLMPPGRNLPQNSVDTIQKWIDRGASCAMDTVDTSDTASDTDLTP
jgi:hypothetical protein